MKVKEALSRATGIEAEDAREFPLSARLGESKTDVGTKILSILSVPAHPNLKNIDFKFQI